MMASIRCPTCGESTSVVALTPGSSLSCRCGRPLEPSLAESPHDPEAIPLPPEPAGTSTPSASPRKLGKYRIERALGAGSFGTVYLAHDDDLGRPVALKVPNPGVLRSADLRERFLKEARAAARMQHRCIVKVYEASAEGATCYIATEFLAGRTLRDVLESDTIDPERAAKIAIELADALAHAHAAGVLHRDLKPSNVMLTESGEVKLIDFGLARVDASSLTGEHALMGTAAYMSPEQASGEMKRVREASDQYNLGAVLFEMLCGSPPFGSDSRFVLFRIAHQPTPRPRELNPSIPAELESICLTTLAKDPSARFQTCRALADALRRWLDSRERGRAPDSSAALAVLSPADPATEPGPASPRLSSLVDPLSVATSGDDPPPDALRHRGLLRDLILLVGERAEAEEQAGRRYREGSAALARDLDGRRQKSESRHEADRSRILSAEKQQVAESRAKLEAGLAAAGAALASERDYAVAEAERRVGEAQERFRWSSVEDAAVYEARQARMEARWEAWGDQLAEGRADYEESWQILAGLAAKFRGSGLRPPDRRAIPPTKRESFDALESRFEEIRGRIDRLDALPGRAGFGELLLSVAAVAASLGLAFLASRYAGRTVAVLAGLAAAAGLVAMMVRSHRARWARIEPEYGPLCRDLASALGVLEVLQARLDRVILARSGKIEYLGNRALRRGRINMRRAIRTAEERRDSAVKAATEAYDATTRRLKDEALIEQDNAGRLARIAAANREALAEIERDREARRSEIVRRRDADFAAYSDRWRRGMDAILAELDAIRAAVSDASLPWDSPHWEDWSPPIESPAFLPFGTIRVGLDRIPRGISEDPRLMEGLPTELAWPALLQIPDRANLLIEAPAAGSDAANRLLQAVLMRAVTGLPPGQVRLTIVDPIGLGSDFGAFFPLADYDDVLATVCTEPGQIEQGLDDLGGHIKKMIRSYLRSEYRSIHEFNRQAKEVAEPIRFLLVSGYPAGFSQTACERLARIVEHGARCGVVTLIAADPAKPTSRGASLRELAAGSAYLTWREGRFLWEDTDFAPFPLEVETPAPSALSSPLIRQIGMAAIDARRVQVPFDLVTPEPDRWWTADSRAGIDVPLGKVGPSKFQSLTLGRGTAQHVLIAGRTGSGKSTLLHALITNLALNYSPDQLELYLLDFKKGVEFNVYASQELPHARVVAVESEREFGVSVLHRLDEEMEDRGERFRQAGVQDLRGYRGIAGLPPLPRVLLIVDEFQEIFVEEDSLAAEAALLLDRLVRQGRAFGVHVLLGSQSLGGAYSLARSTLGQMGVRIALQCSDSDARLILSDENGAARLLSRPGEAIYNDTNGMPDGNHFFQIVWQSEETREDYLRRIRDLARERGWKPAHPPVIFEGNMPAMLSKNPALNARLAAESRPETPRAVPGFLGDAVAIKGPLAASFRRQAGDNLLIVGQDSAAARGMMAAALYSLAAHYATDGPATARFWVLDGTPEGDPGDGEWARVGQVLTEPPTIAGRKGVAAIIAELASIVAERLESEAPGAEDHYLFIHNVAWFRDLRKSDDFDFSGSADPASPANGLAQILKEGAALGVHVVAWADNLANLNRTLDRPSRREFSARVAMQMSAADSSNLLDTPIASKLGHHRAILFDEDQGLVEKFRPYGLPTAEWMAWARAQFLRQAR